MALENYDWERLTPEVYRCRLPFLDVTVGLVIGVTGVLLVDCGTTLAEAAAVADDVAELTGREVTHLVMTHHHFDHVLGSGEFTAAEHYAAPAVAAALGTGTDAVRAYALQYGADPDEIDNAINALRVPDHVGMHARIDLGNCVALVEHPGPGHTDHDLVVVVPPASPDEPVVVFCGDLIEESADPVIDEGSHLTAWPSTLDAVLGLGGPDAIYVPGHGAVVDAGFVRAQRDWLADRGLAGKA
ncbi:MAG: MBL fold metallo-hydrolase [Mycobacterium sp.]|nr:MBL fold metallo-hydrolase [Mycobacterium sp.]